MCNGPWELRVEDFGLRAFGTGVLRFPMRFFEQQAARIRIAEASRA